MTNSYGSRKGDSQTARCTVIAGTTLLVTHIFGRQRITTMQYTLYMT